MFKVKKNCLGINWKEMMKVMHNKQVDQKQQKIKRLLLKHKCQFIQVHQSIKKIGAT